MIRVRLEPDGKILEFPRLNTVLQLLNRLGLRFNQVLVIRGPELLTRDRRLYAGDELTVRRVTSAG
ncbi:MAG: hypothetical protein JW718_03890 [Desulfovibrionaceae bacterium]|nr:hypothetical protein [Desulfovibrionaceae bacterium]